jgi:hypothetical protein
MAELVFDCLSGEPDRYAATPTLTLRLRIAETTGVKVHAIALRCQIRLEPVRRKYTAAEAERLLDLFGEPDRWGDTLKPMQFTTVSIMVPAFTGSTEIDVPIQFTYDFEVVTAKYFHALETSEIPMLLLFSGTVFTAKEGGYAIEQVPWHKECNFRLPVAAWRGVMDLFFPNSGWIRLRRDSLDALQRFKSGQALPTWEDAIGLLLAKAGEVPDDPA